MSFSMVGDGKSLAFRRVILGRDASGEMPDGHFAEAFSFFGPSNDLPMMLAVETPAAPRIRRPPRCRQSNSSHETRYSDKPILRGASTAARRRPWLPPPPEVRAGRRSISYSHPKPTASSNHRNVNTYRPLLRCRSGMHAQPTLPNNEYCDAPTIFFSAPFSLNVCSSSGL